MDSGKRELGDGARQRLDIQDVGNNPLNIKQWKWGIACRGLMMDGQADGTVRVGGAIVMVMERLCQGGQKEKTDKEK